MKLDRFVVSTNSTLHETLKLIESNHQGLIFVTEPSGEVVAVATDGDIRRHLINGGSLEDAVLKCANKNFVWEKSTTPRELLLKKLDYRIQAIPLLDDSKRLVGLFSKDSMPIQIESPVYARARAPVRISFGGGGSDLTHYFSGKDNGNGAVINTTISLYSHATLRVREDSKVIIHSLDLAETITAKDLNNALALEGRFGLIQAVLKAINPDFGFELYLHSDFPMSSGLGGSAVVSASILGCFNQFRRDQWDLHEIAEIAYQAERHYLDVAGGWQDQYATVFGGFNFMEFRMEQNIVHPLRIPVDTILELEESLILCNTGIVHDSGAIHLDQRQQMIDTSVNDLVKSNVQLSYKMRNDLLRGRLMQFGQSMDEAWQFKRQFSNKISSSYLDKIYMDAKSNGVIGGKLLGAGGGGYFLFYVPPYDKHKLISHLKSIGLGISPFTFDSMGLQSWTVRENRNYQES